MTARVAIARATARVASTIQRLFEAYCGFDCAGIRLVEHLYKALIVNLSGDRVDVD
jgi:hypothetical protein